jgi:hypothetical protein
MESIGTDTRVAPIARSPLDSARGRRNRGGRIMPSPSSVSKRIYQSVQVITVP